MSIIGCHVRLSRTARDALRPLKLDTAKGRPGYDALEALHPGELRRLLVAEIERYYDTDLATEIADAASEIEDEIEEINQEVLGEYELQIGALAVEVDRLNDKINSVWHAIQTDLVDRAPDIEGIEWPEPDDGDPDLDPLYDSRRDYIEQLDRYKLHQGKPKKFNRRQGCELSDEHKALIGKANRGFKHSEEAKERMRAIKLAQSAAKKAAKNGGGR